MKIFRFLAVCLLGLAALIEHAGAESDCGAGMSCCGGDSCCDSKMGGCKVGEGDCDFDSHCAGGLKCGVDNCGGSGYDSTDDCCYDPNPATKPPPTTPKAVIPFPIDCKAMRSAENIIRKTRIAYGCNIGNPTISLAQCSEVSCLKGIQTGACDREDDKMDCSSLERVANAMDAVCNQFCPRDEFKYGK